MITPMTPALRFVLAAGVLLVGLGEVRRLVPRDQLQWLVPVDAVFTSGGLGLSVVLAGVGYQLTRALLEARRRGRVAPLRPLVTLAVSVWVVQALVLAAVGIAQLVDTKVPRTAPSLREQWLPLLTFRWNLWVTDHALTVSSELVGLAVFSILVQLAALLTVVVVVLPAHRLHLVVGSVAVLGALLVMLLRARATAFQDAFVLALDTFSRSDAFLAGVAVACLACAGVRVGPVVSGSGALILVGVVLASAFADTDQYFALLLPAVAIVAATVLLDDGDAGGDSWYEALAGAAQTRRLAEWWIPALATAVPVAITMSRRTEMHWLLRVVVAVLAWAVAVRLGAAVLGLLRAPARAGRPLSAGRRRRSPYPG